MRLNIIYITIIVGLALYLVFGHNGLLKYRELVDIQKEYEAQILNIDEQIQYMQRELTLMKESNAYLEYIIRRELGLQKPDEDQYIIKDNAAVPGY